MTEFVNFVKMTGDVGLPIVIAVAVIYIGWKIGLLIPDLAKTYLAAEVEKDKKQIEMMGEQKLQYEEHMRTIITVAQQGIEAQRRGNEIIERNNIIMEAKIKTEDATLSALVSLLEQSKRTEEATKENRTFAQRAFEEIVRIGERSSHERKPAE